MRIELLEIEGFRNLSGVCFEPQARFNVLHGDNGQGKTNLVEAIYLIGRLRSFRAARLQQLLAHGAQSAQVGARVRWPGLSSRVDVELSPRGKRVRVDGKGIGRIGDHCSQYRMVLFTPADVDLPRGAPRERRRFLDRAVFNQAPGFLEQAMSLEKVLEQRNAVLRQARGAADPALLEAYDRQLAAAGAQVACRRRDFVAAIRDQFRATFAQLMGVPGLDADLAYRSTLPGVEAGASPEEVAQASLEALRRARPRDLAQRSTSLGPQRDDLEMSLAGRPLKEHASQGQHRVYVLALKITEIETLRLLGGASPILLLDDIGSELDATRGDYLFRYLSELRSQVFLTTTSPTQVRIPGDRLDLRIVGGRLWNGS